MSANTHAIPPIWFKPRDGFTDACVRYFGFTFDGGPVKPELQPPAHPAGRPVNPSFPSITEAQMQPHRRNGSKAHKNNTVVSRNALQRTARRLVG